MTTEFGKAVKDLLDTEVSCNQAIQAKKKSVKPHIEIEVDPTHPLDIIMKRVTSTGKVSMELYILFSNGIVCIMKDGVRLDNSYIQDEDGLKKFFSGAIPVESELQIGSLGMKKFVFNKKYLDVLKAITFEPKIATAIKNGDVTVDYIVEKAYAGWRDSIYIDNSVDFPWYNHRGYCATTIADIFKDYIVDTSTSRIKKELQRYGLEYNDLSLPEKRLINVIGDYFDIPFGVKCVVEYKNSDMDGLTSNAIEELFCIKNDVNFYSVENYRSSYGASPRYNESYADMRENRDKYFEFKDKKAWWNFIKRASEEGFEKKLGEWIDKWKQLLWNEIYIYGHVTYLYPSRYKYVEENGEIIRVATNNPSMSFMLTTTKNQCEDLAQARRTGELKRIMGDIPSILNNTYEYKGKKFIFKCLETEADFQDEASQQNNCVERICLKNILAGEQMTIFSLRREDEPDKSWITVEINPLTGEIPFKYGGTRQALKHDNLKLNEEETKLIDMIERDCVKKIKTARKKKTTQMELETEQ